MTQPFYSLSAPPHIRSADTVPKIFWNFIISLIPTVVVAAVRSPMATLSILGCSVSAAMLAEIFMKKVFQKVPALHDGSSIFCGILFALLCPVSLPLGLVIAGSFISVALGKEIFGGTGQYLFHPVVLGQAWIHIFFASAIRNSLRPLGFGTLSWQEIYYFPELSKSVLKLFLGFGPGMLGEASVIAILLGGLWLVIKKNISWKISALYLGLIGILSWLCGLNPWVCLFSGNTFLAAVYLIHEPTASPMTENGKRMGSMLTAVVTFILRVFTPLVGSALFAVLIANALTPWLDVTIKPKSIQWNKKAETL